LDFGERLKDRSLLAIGRLATFSFFGRQHSGSSLQSSFLLASQWAPLQMTDKLAQVNFQVEEVQGLVRNNIAKAIERGASLEDLESNSERLESSSQLFSRGATSLRRQQQWRFWRNTLIIVFIVAVIIVLILWWAGAF